MKRKIIKQANQAYTLTLPIDWVKENKIEKGSEVDVKVKEKTLLVTNTGQGKEKKITLDVTNFKTKNIYLHINSLYAAGYDEIEVISKKDISSILAGHLNHLVGFMVVEKTEDKYVLKDLGGMRYTNLDEIFKRVFQSVILFFQSAIEDVYGKQKETNEGLTQRDLEVNKLCFFLQRAINKRQYSKSVRGRALFTYSFELERISDDVLRFWRTNIEEGLKKTKELEEVTKMCLELLEMSFDQYYRFDSTEIEKLYSLRQEIRDRIPKIKGNEKMANQILKIAEEILDLNQLTIMINKC